MTIRKAAVLGAGLMDTTMEETGKPIIIVPDHPVLGSVLEYGDTFPPIIVASPPQAAARALGRMACYADYRRGGAER